MKPIDQNEKLLEIKILNLELLLTFYFQMIVCCIYNFQGD